MSLKKVTTKIQDWPAAKKIVYHWQQLGEEVVFTNGCFDILHYGHLHYLAEAKGLGHRLVIGLNAEKSVKRLKGEHRPIQDEMTRKNMLAALEFVDLVVVFEEDTPLQLIETLLPDVLVKGGDWKPDQIVGSEVVLANGGKVLSLKFIDGYSTSNIENKIKNSIIDK